LQSASVDPVGNISAKGLSGEGYEGHYFWDTEIYMLPMFAFNNPQRAKTLLRYRYNSLPAARERARTLKHKKGVTFPWRMIEKHECSAFYPAGTAQYHINGDIAYAFVQYYLINRDKEFLKECLAEVLIETARIWVDTGFFGEGVFHINQVTGPNEYNCLQDDNYYTNAMARYNLQMAVKLCGELKEWDSAAYEELSARLALTDDELETFSRAAEGMCLLYDEETGINPQDRGFLYREKWDFENTPKENYPLLLHYHPMTLGRYQVCKQADTILAYYLLNDMEPEEVIRRSYDYYEKITTHDSSLSSCIFGILAGQLGQYGKAYDYFMESARLDLDNTHDNTKHGLHLANLGGSWIGVVHGFAGVRVYEDHLRVKPFLPAALQGIRFKLKYRSSTIAFDIRPEVTVLTLLEGPEAALSDGENRFILKDRAKVATGRTEE
ncbi:MAG: glycoside hydrolase family 65 protein, partial [Spirochaetales bacterium]|nr:glycoside hydrolase family 65 protein [Spirochaetales bacterium]